MILARPCQTFDFDGPDEAYVSFLKSMRESIQREIEASNLTPKDTPGLIRHNLHANKCCRDGQAVVVVIKGVEVKQGI
jgi:hypothetical protein